MIMLRVGSMVAYHAGNVPGELGGHLRNSNSFTVVTCLPEGNGVGQRQWSVACEPLYHACGHIALLNYLGSALLCLGNVCWCACTVATEKVAVPQLLKGISFHDIIFPVCNVVNGCVLHVQLSRTEAVCKNCYILRSGKRQCTEARCVLPCGKRCRATRVVTEHRCPMETSDDL